MTISGAGYMRGIVGPGRDTKSTPRSVSGVMCEFTGRDERGVNAKFRTPRMG